FLQLLRVRACRQHRGLGPAQLGGRDQFHGLGDLLDVAHAGDAALNVPHRLSCQRMSPPLSRARGPAARRAYAADSATNRSLKSVTAFFSLSSSSSGSWPVVRISSRISGRSSFRNFRNPASNLRTCSTGRSSKYPLVAA